MSIDAMQVPDGYAAIPMRPGQAEAALRLCVLCRLEADEVGGHLVVLREMADARVFLGCITDGGGRVQQWIEVWVQHVEALADAPLAARDALGNAVLDERWRRYADAFEALDPRVMIRTGAEIENPLPVWVNAAELQPVWPTDGETGEPWRLCRDELVLASAGLPSYAASLHRYLYLPKRGQTSPLVPATAGAPTGARTRPEAIAPNPDLVPLNPAGGLLLIRAFSPYGFESFLDRLAGAPGDGATVPHGKSPLRFDPAPPDDDAGGGGNGAGLAGGLFMGQPGRGGRVLETFHLRLRLLADAVAGVRAFTRRTRRPLLTLDADSFQVRLGDEGTALPVLWTARAALVDPGSAVELPVLAGEAAYFLPARTAGGSIYRPGETTQVVRGRCSVRIRQVAPDAGGATTVEGTFTTQERLVAARRDLVWIRVSLARGPVDLWAYLEPATALARGEWRFRTAPQRLPEAVAQQLKSAEGVPLGYATFDLLPLLSTPCDLYSLGVLAVRALLVNGQATLPVALDEVMSLARELALEHDPSVPLRQRVRAVVESDRRWLEALGPHRLAWDGLAPERSGDLLPPELWWDALAMIVAAFPGVGPDSACADLGDAPAGGLHKVFDRIARELDNLLLRSRSLIVVDWRQNREIQSVIRSRLAGLESGPAEAPPAEEDSAQPAREG